MNQIECILCVKHKLGCSGSIGLSAVSLGSTFLFSSSCLHCVTHSWPSACNSMHVWMYVPCEAVEFFFLSHLSCGPVTHHVDSPTHTPPLSHTQRHSYVQHTIRSGSLNRTHRQATIQASLLFELSCLSHVCLWSRCRQLDGGAVCSYGWGESWGKHQWAEAWHGHASIDTDTHIYSKYRRAALQGQQKEEKKKKPNNNNNKTQSNRVE